MIFNERVVEDLINDKRKLFAKGVDIDRIYKKDTEKVVPFFININSNVKSFTNENKKLRK